MGIGGVPIYQSTPKEKIIEMLEKNGGSILKTAKAIGCHHSTIYELKEKDPEISEAIKKGRAAFVESKTNLAEELLETLITDWQQDRRTALSAAIFHLNNQGKAYGYAHPAADNRFSKDIDALDTNIHRAHEETTE